MAAGQPAKITLLSRPGCHLCDEAETELIGYLAETEADAGAGLAGKPELEVLNIENDDRLHREFLERIPVILLDGEIVSEFAFDRGALEEALAGRQQRAG